MGEGSKFRTKPLGDTQYWTKLLVGGGVGGMNFGQSFFRYLGVFFILQPAGIHAVYFV